MKEFSLLDTISTKQRASTGNDKLPAASRPEDAARIWELLQTTADAGKELSAPLQAFMQHPLARPLIDALAGNSPYLARLIQLQLGFFLKLCEHGSVAAFSDMLATLQARDILNLSQTDIMKSLRIAKQQTALLTATADIGGLWDVMTVTRYLSDFADAAIRTATSFLLSKAMQRNEISLPDINSPQAGSGLLVLGMGKLGAHELNYSSDIDLIILFDKDNAPFCGTRNIQHFFTKFAGDITILLHERTHDGYVFRTDLRLRPDPRSTPPAVNVHSAVTYYESLGQNWERAAMIKARQIAGDPATGHFFEEHIIPYIWRKHLDFAAIADIHSIKRQMTSQAGETQEIGGHNIKLGRGGIREIEFFVQTQQLVWGGRFPELRTKPTLDTLIALVRADLITTETADKLADSYLYLRRVEHHLQMIDDQQTHIIPENEPDLKRLAIFLGYEGPADFAKELLFHCNRVHALYSASMEGTPPLAVDGNLVFTGVEADPETLKTLTRMGYQHPESVSDIIQGWHRGSRRATRSKRARQLLTELVPAVLTQLADTANPDSAFFRFDDFLAHLPAGVQIFSLFTAKPELLDLLAHILGSAPALADILGKQPHLLDIVLQGDFYDALPSKALLAAELRTRMSHARNYEDALSVLRAFKNERQFQAGIQMLRNLTRPSQIGYFLSDLADVILSETVILVQEEFALTHGRIPDSQIAVIALGKLGSRELTFGSDLDLILIYDCFTDHAMSDGDKSVDLRTYYNRLCARIISACTILTREGMLYEIDTRLRPSGGDSPVATRLSSFDHYFSTMAWIFEFMALTKARVIHASGNRLNTILNDMVYQHLRRPHNPLDLATEITSMREKIFAQHKTTNPWDIKHVRGGMIDLDFIAQYLLLRYAATTPTIIQSNSYNIFAAAADAGHISMTLAEELMDANRFLTDLLSFLRLCSPNALIEESSPMGLKNLLVERFNTGNFSNLQETLINTQRFIFSKFSDISNITA